NITGTNLNDTIAITGGGTLVGKLTVKGGNGNDLVSITPAGVTGDVKVSSGVGDDTIVVSTAAAGHVKLDDTTGNDTALILGSQGDDVKISGFNIVTVASIANDSVTIDKPDKLPVTITTAGTIAEDLNITTGNAADG